MPAAAAASQDIKSILDTRPLKFKISTGGAKYECHVHSDRAAYERIKSTRTGSSASISTTSTASSISSK